MTSIVGCCTLVCAWSGISVFKRRIYVLVAAMACLIPAPASAQMT